MPDEKTIHPEADGNESDDDAPGSPSRDDGLSIRKARPRHDEVQPPRGYELQPDGWPVWTPPKGSRKPTEVDKAIAHALIDRIKVTIGEADNWKPGPDDMIMDDEARARLEQAYTIIAGRSYFEAPASMRERHLEDCLAALLRLREQAKFYKSIRIHKGQPDAPRADGSRRIVPPPPPPEERKEGWSYHPGVVVDVPPVAMTGAEIVEGLHKMCALHLDIERTRPLFDDGAAGRLAKLIDELPEGAVNLGGAGGRGGGRTPERWASTIVLALKDPHAAHADFVKRRRRSGRHKAP